MDSKGWIAEGAGAGTGAGERGGGRGAGERGGGTGAGGAEAGVLVSCESIERRRCGDGKAAPGWLEAQLNAK